jgi:hypothetical protein
LSGVPANEGAASAKAKTRMKLRVRIEQSPVWPRRLVGPFDNQVLFRDICTKSGKWFHAERELFRRNLGNETFQEKAS